MPHLSAARYGKDNVRLCKVIRENGVQTVVEMTVCTLLEGDIDVSYTHADNSPVVATDTQKQTIYILAKQHPVNPPELFASTVASHFLDTYKHINAAHVDVIVHRWTRMTVDDKPHPHSFLRDGQETRNVTVKAIRLAPEHTRFEIESGIRDLLVLKSTGSAFYGFHRDDFTRLPETKDRILSTSVDCAWRWSPFETRAQVAECANADSFDKAYQDVRNITLDTFAKDESPSVQNTMYKMAEKVLEIAPGVDHVDYKLPNRHYFEIDLGWYKGLKNTGADAEVYAPQTDPNGLIYCTVSRDR